MAFAYSRIGLRIALPAVVVALGLVGALFYVQRRDAAQQGTETLDVYADLVNRIVIGNTVIDHERVFRSPDATPFEVAAIYTIRGGKIARVDFVKA